MNNKPYLILMVGLPASGKSTIAKMIDEEYDNSVILSTDEIRETEFGDVNDMNNNDKVFKILYHRTKDNLNCGNTVIVDCCNISIKSRRELINIGKAQDCIVCAYIVPTLIDECYERNSKRKRRVPDNVIHRMHGNFQIPFYAEGFDIIKIHYANEPISSITVKDIVKPCSTFDQKNPNHPEGILDIHQNFVFDKFIKQNLFLVRYYSDIHDNLGFLLGVQCHDIGKIFTQSFDNDDIAHYYKHSNVGSYYLLSTFANNTMSSESNTYMQKNTLLDMCFIPNYHMLPYSWDKPKTHEKYKKIFGPQLYDILIRFNNINKIKIDEEGNVIEDGE